MMPRNLLLHRRLLRGGGGRALSYASSFQHHRAPSSAHPPGFHPFGTSPPPSAATSGGGSASAAWPPPVSSRPPPRPYNPMVPYLIRSCGFSFDEALEASELLSGKKRPQNPDFSASSGCGRSPLETQIGWLVSSASLPPGGGGQKKNGAVEDVGFSGRTLAQLMLLDPGVLTGADAARKVGFWSALFRAEADLLRALESNTTHSLGSAPKEKVLRKMILLRGCGVPNRDLQALLRNESAAVARCVDSMEALIKRVEELGLARGREAAYVYAFQVIDKMTERKLESKLGENHKNIGRGGEQKALQALRNRNAFQFPVDPARNAGKAADVSFKEGRVETPNARAHSLPLALCLEKKAMPPYYILQILRSKCYLDENQASYLLRMCKKARLWTNSYASMNREFQSFMRLSSLLVQGRIAT